MLRSLMFNFYPEKIKKVVSEGAAKAFGAIHQDFESFGAFSDGFPMNHTLHYLWLPGFLQPLTVDVSSRCVSVVSVMCSPCGGT